MPAVGCAIFSVGADVAACVDRSSRCRLDVLHRQAVNRHSVHPTLLCGLISLASIKRTFLVLPHVCCMLTRVRRGCCFWKTVPARAVVPTSIRQSLTGERLKLAHVVQLHTCGVRGFRAALRQPSCAQLAAGQSVCPVNPLKARCIWPGRRR